jgi:hypothetical protein
MCAAINQNRIRRGEISDKDFEAILEKRVKSE